MELLLSELNIILRKHNYFLQYGQILLLYRTIIRLNPSKIDPVLPILPTYDFSTIRTVMDSLRISYDTVVKTIETEWIPTITKLYTELRYYYTTGAYLKDVYQIIYDKNLGTITMTVGGDEIICRLNHDLYELLVKKLYAYLGKVDDIIMSVVLRYHFKYVTKTRYFHEISALNSFVFEEIITDYHINLTMGSSPITSKTPFFSSHHADIDKYFGGCGNMQDMDLISGTFLIHVDFNPTYTIPMSKQIIKYLDKATETAKPLCIFYLLPIWDKEILKQMMPSCSIDINAVYDVPQEEYNIIKNAPYHVTEYHYCRDQIPGYNMETTRLTIKYEVNVLVIKNKYYETDVKITNRMIPSPLYHYYNEYDASLKRIIYVAQKTMQFTYIDQTYFIDSIHPIIEYYRGDIIKNIFDIFYRNFKELKIAIYADKINMIATLFIWQHIGSYDPVIPYVISTKYDYSSIRENLAISYQIAENIINELIKKLDTALTTYISGAYLKLLAIYEQGKHLTEPFVVKYNKLGSNSEIRMEYGTNTIVVSISPVLYDRLLSILKKQFYDTFIMNNIIFALAYRYQLLDGRNQQLAISIPLKALFKQKYGVNFELFGSGINRYCDNYCSLFYDVEKWFGSKGNFFTTKAISGYYFCNPPYDNYIMGRMAHRLLKCLDRAERKKLPLLIICTVPIWDYQTLTELKDKCNIKHHILDYGSYDVLTLLKDSKFQPQIYKYCKTDFPYYNFALSTFVYAANTYVIVIRTTHAIDIPIDDYKDVIMDTSNPYEIILPQNTTKKVH